MNGQARWTWTAMPPFPLRGLGSPLVESFRSYVKRISWASGIRDTVRPGVIFTDAPDISAEPSRTGLGLNQDDRLANVVAVVSALTGSPHLRCGTFLSLRDVMHDPTIRSNRRWCPECVDELWLPTGWDPLLWSIGDLACCPLHNCDIVSSCQNCGAKQKTLRKFANTQRCGRCRKPLRGRGHRTAWSQFNTWSDFQIIELVKTYCVPEAAVVDPNTLYQINEALVNADASYVEKSMIAQRFKVGGRPRLATLLQLAAAQAVSLVDLISRPQEALSRNLIDTWSEFSDFPSQLRTVTNHYLGAAISRFLQQDKHAYFPPLRYILREVGVSRTRALDTHLIECRRYEERRRCGQSPAMLDRMDRSFRTALSAVSSGGSLHRPGRYVGALTRMLVAKESLSSDDANAVAYSTKCYRQWRSQLQERSPPPYAERRRRALARAKPAIAGDQSSHSLPSSTTHSLVQQGELTLDGDTNCSSQALEDLPVCIEEEAAVTYPRTD
jgi:TniQ